MTTDNNRYYIPATDNHPLFDSFIINLDLDRHTIVISVFRTPIPPRHEGPAKGHPLIRKIVARIRELLREAGPEAIIEATVKVAYFLVCPKGEARHEWQIPVARNENAETDDHREEVFCIRVPVVVHRGVTSIHPQFAT